MTATTVIVLHSQSKSSISPQLPLMATFMQWGPQHYQVNVAPCLSSIFTPVLKWQDFTCITFQCNLAAKTSNSHPSFKNLMPENKGLTP